MAVAERLMNLMESFDYKSEQYNVCRKVLLTHLAQKPTHDEEVEAWPMTGPAPFEDDVPLPEVAVEKKRKPATKKAASPKEPSAKKPSVAKAKRVRKKKAVSPTGNPEENSGK
jgi:hypothetical protein